MFGCSNQNFRDSARSLPTNFGRFVVCFVWTLARRPETWWKFWKMRDPDVLNVHGKNKKAKVVSFFLERIWKKVQRPDFENSNYHVSSGKLPLVWGVLYYVFFLIWLVCCASSCVYHENSTGFVEICSRGFSRRVLRWTSRYTMPGRS